MAGVDIWCATFVATVFALLDLDVLHAIANQVSVDLLRPFNLVLEQFILVNQI